MSGDTSDSFRINKKYILKFFKKLIGFCGRYFKVEHFLCHISNKMCMLTTCWNQFFILFDFFIDLTSITFKKNL